MKLAKERCRAIYGRLKWISEATRGWIQETLRFRRFSVRGLRNVQGEWGLVCLALNVKRLQSRMPRKRGNLSPIMGRKRSEGEAFTPVQHRSEPVFPLNL